MLTSLRFSRIVFISSLLAASAYIGGYVLWVSAGATLGMSVRASLELAVERPGLWGLGYLLQATAFLLWALVPVSVGQGYKNASPGIAQLSAVVGGFGFAWRALADFARAGSMEFLGRMYGAGDDASRLIAEQLANWSQLWTFGAAWEIFGNGLAFGAFAFLVGLLLVASGKRNLGWVVALLGGLATISLIGTAAYYVAGIRTALDVISLPGLVALFTAPLWLGWFAWLADRESGD